MEGLRVKRNTLAMRVKMLAVAQELQDTSDDTLGALAHQLAMCVKGLLCVARVEAAIDEWKDAKEIIESCVGAEWKTDSKGRVRRVQPTVQTAERSKDV